VARLFVGAEVDTDDDDAGEPRSRHRHGVQACLGGGDVDGARRAQGEPRGTAVVLGRCVRPLERGGALEHPRLAVGVAGVGGVRELDLPAPDLQRAYLRGRLRAGEAVGFGVEARGEDEVEREHEPAEREHGADGDRAEQARAQARAPQQGAHACSVTTRR
jgi:hypothetical protein